MAERQKKRTGPLTAIVILLLLTIVGVELLRMQSKIESAQAEQTGLEDQLAAQRQENASLEAALDKANDPEYLQDLARDQLGYVTPGEKDFYDISN
ncbi:MAG: septum formation initiator family protein [Eubacteriales bacterium]|nr:septum formation initiator family protein [Eubacteriales bacterium]